MVIEQALIIAGTAIMGILGAIHLIYTFFTRRFDAVDPAVTEAPPDSSL